MSRASCLGLLYMLSMGSAHVQADILINEIDVDQIGTDAAEFIEIINTGPGAINFNSQPHVLVLFNGDDDTPPIIDGSYRNVQLTGILPPGGVLLIGASALPEVDIILGSGGTNLIQNGTDAVALYRGLSADWTGQHPPTTTNLVDAIVYDTNDANDIVLQNALGVSTQYDEWNRQDSPGVVFSIARTPGGGLFQTGATPTPGFLNDTSPPVFAMPGVALAHTNDPFPVEVMLLGEGGLAPLTPRVVSLPNHGQLFDSGTPITGSGGTSLPYRPTGILTYAPSPDFAGVDGFAFIMVDAEGRESTPATQDLAVQTGGVIISEVMHAPGTSQQSQDQRIYEFVEIYNTTNDNIALTQLDTTTNNTVNTTENLVGTSGPTIIPPRTMRIIAPSGLTPESDEEFRCEWQLSEGDIIRIPVDQFENMFNGSRLLLFGESGILLDAVSFFPPDFWTSDPGVGDSQAVNESFLFGQPLNARTNDPIIVWNYTGPKNFFGMRTSTSGVGLASPGYVPANLNINFEPEPLCVLPPLGGCCIPDGRCAALSEDGCDDRNGEYASDNLFCPSIEPCPQPTTGYCCTPGGACLQTDAYTCDRANGPFFNSAAACSSSCDPTSGVVINEINYNQLGVDTAEYVEIYGPAGQSIFGYKLIFYDGSPDDRAPYREVPLAGFIPSGEHFVVGSPIVPNVLQAAWTVDAITNTTPAGIVLTRPSPTPPFDDIVVQALSYGGSFVGADGPAAGVTFTDVGIVDVAPADQDATGERVLQRIPNVTGDWFATSDDGLGQDGTPGLINEVPFPAVRGACCLPGGTCLGPMEHIECDQQGGAYQGDGSNCGVDCPITTGACCLAGGSCVTATANQCTDDAGTYFGNGTTCVGIPPCPSPPIGACCLAGGGCTNEDAIDCGLLDGEFRGNGTNCTSQNCGPLAPIVINEIHRDDPGFDDREFIEIAGPGGLTLAGYGLIEIEGDSTLVGQQGRVDQAILLSSVIIPANGLLVIGDAGTPEVDIVIGTDNTLENGTATYALIADFNAAGITPGFDLDDNNDGQLDVGLIIGTVVDAVAIADRDVARSDIAYFNAPVVNATAQAAPSGVARRVDGVDTDSDDDFCLTTGTDDGSDGRPLPTPGRPNFCGSCPTPSDANSDLAINLLDFASLQDCFGATPPTPDDELPTACRCLDGDNDHDIDLADFARFQLEIQGF